MVGRRMVEDGEEAMVSGELKQRCERQNSDYGKRVRLVCPCGRVLLSAKLNLRSAFDANGSSSQDARSSFHEMLP